MFVDVRLFAVLRERAGRESVTVEVADGATVGDAVDAVAREHGLAEVIERMPVVMAVNREYARADATLAEGDELALIPPVSGGASDGGFESGEGYERFMELVGRHVPRPGFLEGSLADDDGTVVATATATATARVVKLG